MASKSKTGLSNVISEVNVGRRLMHSLTAVPALAYLLGIFTWFEIQVFVSFGFIVVFVLEFDRLVLGNSFFDPLYRDYEQEVPAGYAYSVTGLFLAVNLFRPEIACVSVLLLSWADPLAGMLGSGKLKPVKPRKMLTSMFVISLGVILFVDVFFSEGIIAIVGRNNLDPNMFHDFPPVSISLPMMLGGALASTVADGVKLCITSEGTSLPYLTMDIDRDGYILDDNITIPVYSGVVMTLVSALF
ncbi:MAG: hypothetical protein ABEK59_07560 [Halobacteria archaeon]